jgi:hypothetical protein
MRSRLPFVALGVIAGLVVNAITVFAWTGPTASAPGNNVNAPINVGSSPQIKNGDITMNNLLALGNMSGTGDIRLVGASHYINFNVDIGNIANTTGDLGYGIKESGGTLYYKNNPGVWTAFNSVSGVTTVSVTAPITNSGTATAPNIGVGTVGTGNGGTGQTSYTSGDMLYYSSGATLSKLAAGTAGMTLHTGSPPTWAKINLASASEVTGFLPIGNIVGTPSSPSTQYLRGDGTWQAPPSSGGLTQVGITMPGIFTTSNNPLNANGNIGVSLQNQSANLVFAGPSSGAVQLPPTFRALVAADIPNLNASKITTGTMATGILGAGTASASTFLAGNSQWVDPFPSQATHSGQFLTTDGAGVLSWASAGGGTPGGLPTQVQFNKAGAFGGSGNFIWDNANSRLGVGAATLPSYTIDVTGTVRATSFIYSSDRRLKQDIAPISDPLIKISQLMGVSFVWKSGTPKAGEHDVGVIAQDVEKVVPEAVQTDASGYKAVDYARLVPLLISAINEQQKEIDDLKIQVAALRAEQ